MFVDLDRLSYPSWMPTVDISDECCLVPVDAVVLGVGVFDDGGFVQLSLPAIGFVLLKSGGEVPASLADVHFAALAWNLVDSGAVLRITPVLV